MPPAEVKTNFMLGPLRATPFHWVSQLGMLAGTAVYINAGTQLGQLESAAGILSPALLLSFALLGLFPLIVKKLLAWVEKFHAWRRG
jgi:uncharacterized membrane protein YdjX (TVP38/TMEM64 family)